MGESVDGNVHNDGDEIAVGNLLYIHVNLFLPNVVACSSIFEKRGFCSGRFHEKHSFFRIWVVK